MMVQRSNNKTFQRILRQVSNQNATLLMKKAMTANLIAKQANGVSRRSAYRVKVNALISLKNCVPDKVSIRKDWNTPDYVIVVVKHFRFGLHAPENIFLTGEN